MGASVTFGESTLGQLFKEKFGGEYAGGPAFYMKKGIRNKQLGIALGMLYAVIAVIAPMITGPTVQAFNIADSMHAAFGIDYVVIGAAIAILFAVVTFGGVKRIGTVASVLVPFMGIAYIVLALVILVLNAPQIPAMFGLIFSSAFGMNAVYGGLIGSAVMWGIKRALYASDAGTGQGAHASSATEVSHPVKQGLAESFSVYVVAIFICTATALMILSTGCYNVIQETTGAMVTENLPGVGVGSAYVQAAINTLIPGAGPMFVAIAVLLFAFTTLMAFGFMIEANISYLMGDHPFRKAAVLIGRIICTVVIFFSCLITAEVAWNMADIGVALMAWTNLVPWCCFRIWWSRPFGTMSAKRSWAWTRCLILMKWESKARSFGRRSSERTTGIWKQRNRKNRSPSRPDREIGAQGSFAAEGGNSIWIQTGARSALKRSLGS